MFESISRNAKMYLASQKYKLRRFFIYRMQAFTWLIAFMLGSTYQIVVATVIYTSSSGINGWTYYQMLALGGLANIFAGIMLFTLSPHNLGRLMRNGQLDQWLIKPYNPILMLLSITGAVSALGSVIVGIATLSFALIMAKISIFSLFAMLAIFIIGAIDVVLFELLVILASYVLFRSSNFVQWIFNIGKNAVSYPLSIYGIAGLVLFTAVMPIGLATFFPAEALFSKIETSTFAFAIALEIIFMYAYYKASAWLLTKYSSGGG
ncbi:MAG: ABC-2 family transporter protein [Candidatus Micrarchaeia archaeon]